MTSSLGHPRQVPGFTDQGFPSSKPQYHDSSITRHRVVYEKDFNIGQTQVNRRPSREVRDSMLAYSEHMRHLNKRKYQTSSSTDNTDMSSLQVHAIPKVRELPKIKHLSRHTKRLTLDNRLTSRSHDDFDANSSSRKSQFRSKTAPPPVVGSVDTNGSKKKEELRLNFVSASDLYEILSDKGSKSSKSSSTDSIPSAWESPRKARTYEYVNSTRSTDGPISGRTKRKVNRRSNQVDIISDRSVNESDSVNQSTLAESIKAKQEEEAKKLLRSALRKLQEMEEKKATDPLKLPRLKRKKKISFQKTRLDAIPEAEREDSFFDMNRRSSGKNKYQNHNQSKSKGLDIIEETASHDTLPRSGGVSPEMDIVAKKRQFSPQHHIRHSWSLLPPIASQEEFQASGPGDTFKTKRLNLRAKNKVKSKKIRFLKGE